MLFDDGAVGGVEHEDVRDWLTHGKNGEFI